MECRISNIPHFTLSQTSLYVLFLLVFRVETPDFTVNYSEGNWYLFWYFESAIPDWDLEIIVKVHCLQYKESTLYVCPDLVQDLQPDLIGRLNPAIPIHHMYRRKTLCGSLQLVLSARIMIRPCRPILSCRHVAQSDRLTSAHRNAEKIEKIVLICIVFCVGTQRE